MSEEKREEVGHVYFHISNGGVGFAVEDGKYGPFIRVKASHFGHETNNLCISVRKEDFKYLAELFKKASEHTYSHKEYCYAARVFVPNSSCCGEEGCCTEEGKEKETSTVEEKESNNCCGDDCSCRQIED